MVLFGCIEWVVFGGGKRKYQPNTNIRDNREIFQARNDVTEAGYRRN